MIWSSASSLHAVQQEGSLIDQGAEKSPGAAKNTVMEVHSHIVKDNGCGEASLTHRNSQSKSLCRSPLQVYLPDPTFYILSCSAWLRCEFFYFAFFAVAPAFKW